jgi:hypothetical protein
MNCTNKINIIQPNNHSLKAVVLDKYDLINDLGVVFSSYLNGDTGDSFKLRC